MADDTKREEVVSSDVTPQNAQSRKKLYTALSGQFDIGSFEKFDKKMNSPDSRRKLYDTVSPKFELGPFEQFEGKVGKVTTVPAEAGKANVLFSPSEVTAKAPTFEEQYSTIPQAPSVGDKKAFAEKYGFVDPKEVSDVYSFMPFTAPFVGIEQGLHTINEAADTPGDFITDPATGLRIPVGEKAGKFVKGATELASSAAGFVPSIGAVSTLIQTGEAATKGLATLPSGTRGNPFKIVEKGEDLLTKPVSTLTQPKTQEGKDWAETADQVTQLILPIALGIGAEAGKSLIRNRLATEIKGVVTPSDLRSMFVRVKTGIGTDQEVKLTQTIAQMYLAGPEGQPVKGIEQATGRMYKSGTPKWVQKILGEFPPDKVYPQYRFLPKDEETPATPREGEATPTGEELPKGLLPAGPDIPFEQKMKQRTVTSRYPHNAPLNIKNAQAKVGKDIFNAALQSYVESRGMDPNDVENPSRIGSASQFFSQLVLDDDPRAQKFIENARSTARTVAQGVRRAAVIKGMQNPPSDKDYEKMRDDLLTAGYAGGKIAVLSKGDLLKAYQGDEAMLKTITKSAPIKFTSSLIVPLSDATPKLTEEQIRSISDDAGVTYKGMMNNKKGYEPVVGFDSFTGQTQHLPISQFNETGIAVAVAKDIEALNKPFQKDWKPGEVLRANHIGYRVPTGYEHSSQTSALDVINSEADDNGNLNIREDALNAAKQHGIDLSKIPANQILWVTKTRDDASHYAHLPNNMIYEGQELSPEEHKHVYSQIEPTLIPRQSVVLSDIGSDGVLVAFGPAVEKAKPQVGEATPDPTIDQIKTLIGQGKTNAEIQTELNVPQGYTDTIRKAINNVGATDLANPPTETGKIPTKLYTHWFNDTDEVSSVKEASELWLKYRKELDLPDNSLGGEATIRDDKYRVIAHVDYDGTVYGGSKTTHDPSNILYKPPDAPAAEPTPIPGTPRPPVPEGGTQADGEKPIAGSNISILQRDHNGNPVRLASQSGSAEFDNKLWTVRRGSAIDRVVIGEAAARMLLGDTREMAEQLTTPTTRSALSVDEEYKIAYPDEYYQRKHVLGNDPWPFLVINNVLPITLRGFEDLDLFIGQKQKLIIDGATGVQLARTTETYEAHLQQVHENLKSIATDPWSFDEIRRKSIDDFAISPRYEKRNPEEGELTKPGETPILPAGEETTYGNALEGTTNTQASGSDVEATPGVDEGEPAGTIEPIVQGGETAGIPGREGGTGGERPGKTPVISERPSGGIRKPGDRTGGRTGGNGRPGTGAAATGGDTPNQPVGTGNDQPPEQLNPTTPNDFNHVILPEHNIVPAGEVGRIKANLQAIKLLIDLEKANRNPSPEEKEILARYVGWGGIPNVFNEAQARLRDERIRQHLGDERIAEYYNWEKKYGKYYDELKTLLSDKELNAAAESTINAFYTSREIIQHGLWSIVKRLGFSGGRAMEPAGGIGHIIGLTPAEMRQNIKWTGVELDNLTGRLLTKLYPQAKVHITGFQTAPIPNNHYSLVITNVPFGKTGPFDQRYPQFSLHNYFFARSLDALKPGGLMVAITSISTLDNNASIDARKWLADKADLVGAIRLPDNAFKANANAEVTADILVFRKKDGNSFTLAQPFQKTRDITTKDGKSYHLNEYFVNNTSMMLGEMAYAGKMFPGGTITLSPFEGQELPAQLDKAVTAFPENIASLIADGINENEQAVAVGVPTKEGAFIDQGGKIFQAIGNEMNPIGGLTPKEESMVRSFIGVRDVLKNLLTAQVNPEATDADIEKYRKQLNELYDKHVAAHKEFLRSSGTILSDDPEYPLVASLEDIVVTVVDQKITSGPNKGQMRPVNNREYRKAPIFSQRTQFPRVEPTTVATIEDGVSVSMNYRNRIDLDYMSKLLSTTTDDVKSRLLESGKAFENPTTGLLETPEEYLSGNVRKKLREAENSSRDNAAYSSNIEALKPIIPPDIPWHEIGLRLGTSWIPKEYVGRFLSEVLDVGADVYYVKKLHKWIIKAHSGYQASVNTDMYGGGGFGGHELVEDSLNLKNTIAFDTYRENGKEIRVKNVERTLEAQAMQEKINNEFISYMKAVGPEDQNELTRIYNDKFNSYVERKFVGPSWDYYPGASNAKKLRPHQKAMVSRNLTNSTGVFHSVGTGKTLVGITTLMEMKRLGLAKKGTFIAQNATVTQVAAQAKESYPAARILAPNENERSAEKRQLLLSRIATGNWDIVVLPQSFAELIPDDPERVNAVMSDEIEEMKRALYETAELEGKNSPSVKAIIRQVKRLEEQFKKQATRRQDNVIYWDQLGIDAMIVDEAHAYKKLGFNTGMQNIKGIDTGRSQRAFSMFMKSRLVQERSGGKNVIFMTGTPITNTMAEIWTMIRYLRPDLLEEYGIQDFDAFAANFGDVVPAIEYTSTAQYKVVSRFAKFQNGPELIKLIRTVGDIVLAEDVKLPGVPKVKGGKPEEVKITRSLALSEFIGHLRKTLKEWEALTGKEKRELSYIPLTVHNKAKQAAIDLRLINPKYPEDPNGKVNTSVKRIISIYNEFGDQKATQLVFADLFQSPPQESKFLDEDKKIPNPAYGKGDRFNLYDDIKQKLMRGGIPKDEIAIKRDYNTDAKKSALYAAVNSGKIRVVIGSTENLGMGVNVNERLIALHHLDAPPRPMDLEQRNGRIIRQGNLFPEVQILIYGVEQTLDATAFQRLVIKQKFINQVMRGNLTSRTFDDPADDVQMTLSEIMADLTGDPLALARHAEEVKVRQLESLKASHQQKLRKVATEIRELRESVIPKQERDLQKHQSYQKELTRDFPDGKISDVTILNQKYSGKEVSEALNTFFTAQFKFGQDQFAIHGKDVSLSGHYQTDIAPIRVGENILESRLDTATGKDQYASWSLFLPGGHAPGEGAIIRGKFTTPNGFTNSFIYAVKNHPDTITDLMNMVERSKKQIADKEEYLKSPFDQESELLEHQRRLAEIEQELQEKTKDKIDEPDDQSDENPPPGELNESRMDKGASAGRKVRKNLTPRLREMVSEEAMPSHNIRDSLEPIVRTKDWILATFAPTTMGIEAKTAAQLLRTRLGDLAHKREVVLHTLKDAREHFKKMNPAHNLDFIDAIETGTPIADPVENEAAHVLRQLLESRWTIIQQRKGTKAYIENYFPHMWTDPAKAKAILTRYYGRRPLAGSKEYMKQRKIPTTKEGVMLGLKPKSDNPIDLVIARVYDMDRYIMATDLKNDLQQHGMWEFHPIGEYPEGMAKLDDKFGTVFGNPEIPVKEYVDEKKYNKLLEIMDNLGIKYDRRMRVRGGVMGYHQGNDIVTRFGTPLGTIIHEIGHHLDEKFGLGDKFVNNKATREEIRKLADLRFEGANPTEHFKQYVRKHQEKMANMIEAFIEIPEQFKRIAPNTWAMLNRFIDRTPAMQPLRDIQPSLMTKELESSVSAGGMVVHGNYWLPENAAAVINNYLSPGLRGNMFFESWRGLGNIMNMLQLGVSAFHLSFTAVDAMTSSVALSIQELFAGKPLQAVKKFAELPVAPITTYVRGSKLLSDYIKQNPENVKLVDAIVNAGGRIRMDRFYYNSAVEKFWDAVRSGKKAAAVWQAPWAAIEAAAWPVLGIVVPRMKLGVFADMSRFIFERAEDEGWERERTIQELQTAWDSVDNRMGQLVYDNLFWNRAVKDIGLSSVRSLGWNLGTFREIGGGAYDFGKQGYRAAHGKGFEFTPRMAYLTALPAVAALIGSILGYLMTGNKPKELKDCFFPKTGRKNSDGKDERVSFPTYMKDIYAYKDQPLTTAEDKIHPFASMVAQMLNNHDYYGTEIRNPDDPLVRQAIQSATYVSKQFIPFSVRGYEKLGESGANFSQKVQAFAGINPVPKYLDEEPWEKKMYDELGRRGINFRTPEKGEVSQFRAEFASKMHAGRLSQSDMQKARSLGLIGGENTFDQQLMDMMIHTPEERAFKRMELKEAVEVFKMMPIATQKQYQPLLIEKMANSKNLEQLLPELQK